MKRFIYLTTNLLNNKQYIGKQHFKEHKRDDYLGSGILLKKAVRKNGKGNFRKEILEECETDDQLNIQENYWILNKNTLYPNGYNLSLGGDGGDTFTNSINKEITRSNRSKAVKEYWNNLSKEDKELRAKLIRNKKRSKETCENISKGKKGKKMSAAHKMNMIKAVSEAKAGKITYNQRAVDMYDLKENYLQSFASISQASKETGHNSYTICKICQNKQHHVKNHVFKYKN